MAHVPTRRLVDIQASRIDSLESGLATALYMLRKIEKGESFKNADFFNGVTALERIMRPEVDDCAALRNFYNRA